MSPAGIVMFYGNDERETAVAEIDDDLPWATLARRVIAPAIEKGVVCRKSESEHKPEGHMFQLDKAPSMARLARVPAWTRNQPQLSAR